MKRCISYVMRIQRRFIVLVLTVGLLLASALTVLAVPPLPSSFYGTVKVDGANVPVGTTVSAWINGVKYAETTVLLYEGDTVYSLDVPGDDPETPNVEGGISGDAVIFHIDDQGADQTASWQSGTNVNLDLTHASEEMEEYRLFLPWVAQAFRRGHWDNTDRLRKGSTEGLKNEKNPWGATIVRRNPDSGPPAA
jgi:hypothetical protein